jgi:hypothetical protein
MNLPKPNKQQATFLWIVGIVALIVAANGVVDDNPYAEHSPSLAALIGAVAILFAMSYRKPV